MDDVRYQYGFVVDDERFVEEWLYAWPKGRKQTWLEREGDSFKFGEHLHGENKLVQQVTRPNALFLATAVQHRHEQLAPLYRWFQALLTVNVIGRGRGGGPGGRSTLYNWIRHYSESEEMSRQPSLFEDAQSTKDLFGSFRDLLRAADIGIVDFKLEDEAEQEDGRLRFRRPQVMVQHRSSNGEAWLPLEEESQGTVTLFQVGPVLVETLRRGGVLVVDELEASLHPLLAIEIVKLFNDLRANPYNAQLLFTTHDTNLLGTTIGETSLRRDEIWLTEKDDEGATCLYPLTDYKPRKAENIERGYLQGRYGAIPYLGDLARWDEQ